MNVPLSMVKTGTTVKVVGFHGGMMFIRRINEMGIRLNETYKVISNVGQGRIILGSGSLRIGLGEGMASKIDVEIVDEK